MNLILNQQFNVIDLGLIDYQKAWDYQTQLFEETLAVKKANRERSQHDQQLTPNYLLFCEHPPVYTLGKSGEEKNLLINKDQLHTIGATYFQTNRGGDITYHGPGQLVCYPVIDLENFFTDIHRYMRLLEESIIQIMSDYQLIGTRIPGLTGVWLTEPDRKICAMGVKTSRWVTMHGLAFNVNTDLSYFDQIIPCGINDKAVTSLEKELGAKVDLETVKRSLRERLTQLFEFQPMQQ